jgi:hypothetical protein
MSIDVSGEDLYPQMIMSKHFNDDEWPEALEYYHFIRRTKFWDVVRIGFSVADDAGLEVIDDVLLYEHRETFK